MPRRNTSSTPTYILIANAFFIPNLTFAIESNDSSRSESAAPSRSARRIIPSTPRLRRSCLQSQCPSAPSLRFWYNKADLLILSCSYLCYQMHLIRLHLDHNQQLPRELLALDRYNNSTYTYRQALCGVCYPDVDLIRASSILGSKPWFLLRHWSGAEPPAI